MATIIPISNRQLFTISGEWMIRGDARRERIEPYNDTTSTYLVDIRAGMTYRGPGRTINQNEWYNPPDLRNAIPIEFRPFKLRNNEVRPHRASHPVIIGSAPIGENGAGMWIMITSTGGILIMPIQDQLGSGVIKPNFTYDISMKYPTNQADRYN